MPHDFDPYYRWLGIPPAEQPADHYRLLGLSRFETEPEVIRDAAERQMAHVRRYALGKHRDLSQQILNELGGAKACLLNEVKKAAYDDGLRTTQPKTLQLGPVSPPMPPVAQDQPPYESRESEKLSSVQLPPRQASDFAEPPKPQSAGTSFKTAPSKQRQFLNLEHQTGRSKTSSVTRHSSHLLYGTILRIVSIGIGGVVGIGIAVSLLWFVGGRDPLGIFRTNDPQIGSTDTNDPQIGSTDTNDPEIGPTDTNDPEIGPTDTNDPDTPRHPVPVETLLKERTRLIRELYADVDIGTDLLQVARKAAASGRDRAMWKRVTEKATEFEDLKKEFSLVSTARGRMKEDPTDAEANLTLGKYYCFTKGQWEQGLPMLARGSDAELKQLATREIAGPADPAAMAGLADDWWQFAEKKKKRRKPTNKTIRQAQLRATRWYHKSLPGLDGLARDKALQRLEQLVSETNQSAPFAGRGKDRIGNLQQAGGTEASEAAVESALQWFVKHQYPDGGWSFDHRGVKCQCKNHGTLETARIGATAMALLPFLGAGHTHQAGEYRKEVQAGLSFLGRSMSIEQGQLGKLWEPGGSMYSQGLATITLCEAYGMTRDEDLMGPAQMALNYLMGAQYSTDGGWRYSADPAIERGDTLVVGWALTALMTGNKAGLAVSEESFRGASHFLDSVQSNGGATYGYTDPGGSASSATTAIGLLCRMYLGWDRDNKALQQGVKALGEHGPAEANLYYNYYATQVLRHYGGPLWEKWNEQMREHLIVTQSKRGHPAGSWHLPGGHAGSGGRHYCTSMATMILEVYYRHLPVFRGQPVTEDAQLADGEVSPPPENKTSPVEHEKDSQPEFNSWVTDSSYEPKTIIETTGITSATNLEKLASQEQTAANALGLYRMFLQDRNVPDAEKLTAKEQLPAWEDSYKQKKVRVGRKWLEPVQLAEKEEEERQFVEDALTRIKSGQFKEMLQAIKRAKRANPASVRSDFLLGVGYALINYDVQKAGRHFNSCVNRLARKGELKGVETVNYVSSLNNLALTTIRARDYHKALSYWSQALETSGSPEIVQNIGRMHFLYQRRDKKGVDPRSTISLSSQNAKRLETLLVTDGFDSATGWLYMPYVPKGATPLTKKETSPAGIESSMRLIGSGKGFVVQANCVMTTADVVKDAEGIVIVAGKADTRKLSANVQATSEPTGPGLVLLQCQGLSLPPLRFSETHPQMGSRVSMLGYRTASDGDGSLEVARAHLAGLPPLQGFLGSLENYKNNFVYNVGMIPGSSGGPACDAQGNVVAVNTAIVLPNAIGGGYAGGVPARLATEFIKKHVTGYVTPPGLSGVAPGNDSIARVANSTVSILVYRTAERLSVKNAVRLPYEDCRCMACNGLTHVECPVSRCAQGRVGSFLIETTETPAGPFVEKFPIRVRCETCEGAGRVECQSCEKGVDKMFSGRRSRR